MRLRRNFGQLVIQIQREGGVDLSPNLIHFVDADGNTSNVLGTSKYDRIGDVFGALEDCIIFFQGKKDSINYSILFRGKRQLN